MPQSSAPHIVTTSELAIILGVSDRWVRELGEQGIFPPLLDQKNAKVVGKWDLRLCVQAYIKKIKAESATKSESKEKEAAELRRLIAKAEQDEIKVQLMRSETIPLASAIEVYGEHVSNVRTKFLGMPVQIASLLVGQTERPVIVKILLDKIEEILDMLNGATRQDLVRANPHAKLTRDYSDTVAGTGDGNQEDMA